MNCTCYVSRLSPQDRFCVRRGAHEGDCPQYRPSVDPVDAAEDLELRQRHLGLRNVEMQCHCGSDCRHETGNDYRCRDCGYPFVATTKNVIRRDLFAVKECGTGDIPADAWCIVRIYRNGPNAIADALDRKSYPPRGYVGYDVKIVHPSQHTVDVYCAAGNDIR